jgi:hypothetical protein
VCLSFGLENGFLFTWAHFGGSPISPKWPA